MNELFSANPRTQQMGQLRQTGRQNRSILGLDGLSPQSPRGSHYTNHYASHNGLSGTLSSEASFQNFYQRLTVEKPHTTLPSSISTANITGTGIPQKNTDYGSEFAARYPSNDNYEWQELDLLRQDMESSYKNFQQMLSPINSEYSQQQSAYKIQTQYDAAQENGQISDNAGMARESQSQFAAQESPASTELGAKNTGMPEAKVSSAQKISSNANSSSNQNTEATKAASETSTDDKASLNKTSNKTSANPTEKENSKTGEQDTKKNAEAAEKTKSSLAGQKEQKPEQTLIQGQQIAAETQKNQKLQAEGQKTQKSEKLPEASLQAELAQKSQKPQTSGTEGQIKDQTETQAESAKANAKAMAQKESQAEGQVPSALAEIEAEAEAQKESGKELLSAKSKESSQAHHKKTTQEINAQIQVFDERSAAQKTADKNTAQELSKQALAEADGKNTAPKEIGIEQAQQLALKSSLKDVQSELDSKKHEDELVSKVAKSAKTVGTKSANTIQQSRKEHNKGMEYQQNDQSQDQDKAQLIAKQHSSANFIESDGSTQSTPQAGNSSPPILRSFAQQMAQRLQESPLAQNLRQLQFRIFDQNRGEIRLRLNPENLGHVRIHLSISGSQLSGQIIADTPEAARIMQQHMQNLEASLRSGGFENQGLQVSLSGGQAGDSGAASDSPNPSNGNYASGQTADSEEAWQDLGQLVVQEEQSEVDFSA